MRTATKTTTKTTAVKATKKAVAPAVKEFRKGVARGFKAADKAAQTTEPEPLGPLNFFHADPLVTAAGPELGNAQGIRINNSKKVIKPKAAKAAKATKTASTDGIETKGKSKVTAEEVLAIHRLKVSKPGTELPEDQGPARSQTKRDHGWPRDPGHKPRAHRYVRVAGSPV
jgi:hypothetical protein